MNDLLGSFRLKTRRRQAAAVDGPTRDGRQAWKYSMTTVLSHHRTSRGLPFAPPSAPVSSYSPQRCDKRRGHGADPACVVNVLTYCLPGSPSIHTFIRDSSISETMMSSRWRVESPEWLIVSRHINLSPRVLDAVEDGDKRLGSRIQRRFMAKYRARNEHSESGH